MVCEVWCGCGICGVVCEVWCVCGICGVDVM